MKTFTLCCTLLGLVVLGTRADFTRPGHRKDWPEIDRLGAFADTIDWFAKFQERVYLVTKDDKVYAFGNQTTGDALLGLNIIEELNIAEPKEIIELRDKKIIKLVSSYRHMLALSADGNVWSWGKNSHAELGVGNNADHLTPVHVDKIIDVGDIVAANGFSLALTKTGQVIAWGYNSNNECGIGQPSMQQTSPVKVHLDHAARSLHTTNQGTSVVLTDRSELYAWGYFAAASPTLLKVPAKQVGVTTANQNYYVVTEDGHIWRSLGETDSEMTLEVYYKEATKFKALHADQNGDNFLVGEATDGKLWVWTDADFTRTPVLSNARDVVQAFAVHHPKGFLPFMVKL